EEQDVDHPRTDRAERRRRRHRTGSGARCPIVRRHSPMSASAQEPGDSDDRLRRRVLWSMPSGLYLLGSCAGDRRNLMTMNWAMQVSLEPKLLAVSVESTAVTHELVSESRAFALN